MASNHISVAPLAPVTTSGTTFTFPIGVELDALVRGPSHRVCHSVRRHSRQRCLVITHLVTARIARITDVSISNGTATGTVNITAFTARVVNRLAGKHVISAGAVLGTASTTPTLR